jgi:hypothetical protein
VLKFWNLLSEKMFAKRIGKKDEKKAVGGREKRKKYLDPAVGSLPCAISSGHSP